MKKNINHFLRNIFAALLVSLLWACSAASSPQPSITKTFLPTFTLTSIPATLFPSDTPSPTITPTITSTPVPTLVAHEWIPSEPLISFGNYGGDGSCGDIMPLPDFTLLSDGELFVMRLNDQTQAYGLQTTTLSREDTCKLLNSIDQTGFFDYDSSTYISDPQNWQPPGMGAESTYISVQAWRSNSVSLYDLGDFINNVDKIKKDAGCGECPELEFPTILPSIRKAYQLLEKYQPVNLEIYKYKKLGVWVNTNDVGANDVIPWPIKSIKLSEAVTKTDINSTKPNLIFDGDNAAIVNQLFIQHDILCGVDVRENGKVYNIEIRPLLPYEYQSSIQAPTPLSCSPADGWIQVP